MRRQLLSLFFAFGFLAIGNAQSARADRLTVYNYASPGLDWSSPRQLGRTLLGAYASLVNGIRGDLVYPIGHVSVEVKCEASDFGAATHFAAGMQPRSSTESLQVLFIKRAGLGMLFYNLKGHLDATASVLEDNAKFEKMGKGMNFVTFKINSETCQRLAQFHAQYIAGGHDRWYGLPNRPRYREGGGCSAFGASFVEVAGLLTPEMKAAWTHTIDVPESLIGEGGKKVRFAEIIRDKDQTRRWAYPWEESRQIFFYDPDLMYGWVNDAFAREAHSPSGEVELQTRGKLRGIVLDRTGVATPAEPIFLD